MYKQHGHLLVEAYYISRSVGGKGYWKFTLDYHTYVGSDIFTKHSQNQKVDSCSGAKVGYRAMKDTTCKMVWLQYFLQDWGVKPQTPISMNSNNQEGIFIAKNLTLYKHTKHKEIDCHFIHEQVLKGVISTLHVASYDQLPDVFTKSLNISYDSLSTKLGIFDLYVSTST